jgi:hypothetical protein
MMFSVIGHPVLRLLLHEIKATITNEPRTIANNIFFIGKRFNRFYFAKLNDTILRLIMKNGLYFNLLLKIPVNYI